MPGIYFHCARAPGADACYGDSGGPFTMQEENRAVLIGVREREIFSSQAFVITSGGVKSIEGLQCNTMHWLNGDDMIISVTPWCCLLSYS